MLMDGTEQACFKERLQERLHSHARHQSPLFLLTAPASLVLELELGLR